MEREQRIPAERNQISYAPCAILMSLCLLVDIDMNSRNLCTYWECRNIPKF